MYGGMDENHFVILMTRSMDERMYRNYITTKTVLLLLSFYTSIPLSFQPSFLYLYFSIPPFLKILLCKILFYICYCSADEFTFNFYLVNINTAGGPITVIFSAVPLKSFRITGTDFLNFFTACIVNFNTVTLL